MFRFAILFSLIVLGSSLPVEDGSNKVACPRIISRADWGARPPTNSSPMTTPVTYAVIHHSVTAACTTETACKASVRQIQNMHMDGNGWADVGYSFLVGGDGNVYTGRGWNKVGAHAPGANTNSIGICLIGDWRTSLPTAAQLTAAKNLIACGVTNGYIKSAYKLVGHRDVVATECPGQRLFTEISTWPRKTTFP